MAVKDERWIESFDVLSLFPTFVWNIRLRKKHAEAINRDLLEALTRLRRNHPPLAPGEAWQSGLGLHKDDAFSELVF